MFGFCLAGFYFPLNFTLILSLLLFSLYFLVLFPLSVPKLV